MIINIAYSLDCAKNTVNPLAIYSIENLAKNGIENFAKDLVKEKFGEFHLAKCVKYDLNINQILADKSLGEGYYLTKDNDKIIVVHKYPYTCETLVKRDVLKKVLNKVNIPKTITIPVVEKVKRVSKKIVKEEISYIASFYTTPTVKEIEIEEEVDEIVNKEFKVLQEVEVYEDCVTQIEEKRTSVNWIASKIQEYYYIAVDIGNYVNMSNNNQDNVVNSDINDTAYTVCSRIENPVIINIKASYLEELKSMLKNTIVSNCNIRPSELRGNLGIV